MIKQPAQTRRFQQ